ncbi:hypothetical protein IQ266_15530 [filamentous cyanobacterium LEGE 11480]|uniref:Uncharacterized protein n=1 Tax=Romeriopsis navalis LEGE 11480 TaxID=2777977 RepID=A0A928Z5D5_9CYAN|nr:hypothetical protein [Romeriopsis navalis]MBE9031145.1 hypothetical protein [Romeriopsis navalis LEGE 11480]
MSDLSLKQMIVPALLTTGAVFTALSAPVVMLADTPVQLSQGNKQIYNGPVRDAAMPYLMLAGITSVGLGISGVAVAGWRKSAKQAAALNDRVNDQEQRRAERESHLKAALTSENYLEKTGLSFFLEDGDGFAPFEPQSLPIAQSMPIAAVAEPPAAEPTIATPTVELAPTAKLQQPALEDLDMAAQLAWLDGVDPAPVSTTEPKVAMPITAPIARKPPSIQPVLIAQPIDRPVVKAPAIIQPSHQPTAAPLVAAQKIYGFARSSEATSKAARQDTVTIDRIQSLQDQLQAIVTQIESLQANLPETAAPATIQVVEEVPSNQSGLVQQAFQVTTEVGHSEPVSRQQIRRVAS